MKREDWEAICNRCGKCCYEKVDLGGGIIRYLDEPCKHLDTTTNLCKVYRNRRVAEPDCISLTEDLVRSLGWLPEECAVPGVRALSGHPDGRSQRGNREKESS